LTPGARRTYFQETGTVGNLTRASALRILLVAVLGVCVLEYVWLETQSGRPAPRSGVLFGMLPSAGCPDPAQAGSFGQMSYDWSLQNLEGREVSAEEFRHRPLFVNLWATWCAPCVVEMPTIQALYDSVKDEGVAFLVVSEENFETVREFLREQAYTFPVYVSRKLPTVLDAPGVPATFIANREGTIVWKHIGAARWDSDACRKLLRSLR